MNADTSIPETRAPSGLAAPAPTADGLGLVHLARRLMLGANLLLAAYFSFFVVRWYGCMSDIVIGMGVRLPAWAMAVLSVPGLAYKAASGAIAVALIVLEVLAPRRRATFAANAAALILLLPAVILVEIAVCLPLISIVYHVGEPVPYP